MTSWLSDSREKHAPLAIQVSPRVNAQLRCFDVMASSLTLVLLLLPLTLALMVGRLTHTQCWGLQGRPFMRWQLTLSTNWLGRTLSALGAQDWPVLFNVLRGDMAFVGPRPAAFRHEVTQALRLARPGLVNTWFIRRCTAVDFDSELQSDLEDIAQRGLRHDVGVLARAVLVSAWPAKVQLAPGRVQLCDVAFDNVNMNDALARIRDMLDQQPRVTQQVCFVNPACVNIAARHRGYRRALARAALVLPDGIGTKIAGDLLGTPLKQNVNGTDLFPRLMDMLNARGARVFLLGGQQGVPETVAAEISSRWPQVQVVGVRDGFYAVADEGAVATQVRDSGADVLLVARGVPSQDLFIDRHLQALGVKVAMGVGGLFDFVSGRIHRAPAWMRETGLEWLYRLLQEPGRMWKRYLIGNFTFLIRVGLQRIHLRRPATDVVTESSRDAKPEAEQGVRAIIFATQRADADFPVMAGFPCALLPVGHLTVLEHLIQQLASAAVTHIDLVISDCPELIRQQIGDGGRWGVQLNWHLEKDPCRPYGVLMSPSVRSARRLVIGHADAFLSNATVLSLANRNQVAMHIDRAESVQWSGWASLASTQLAVTHSDMDRAELGKALAERAVYKTKLDANCNVVTMDARNLLRSQWMALSCLEEVNLPASWIRTDWGAMSPLSHVHPEAEITGPVLIGPGCMVERGATLGPGAVLSHNVVVSGGTSIRDSLVLPNTYIGSGLEVERALINGTRLRHVNLELETRLPESDGLLLSLKTGGKAGASWLGRGLAAMCLVTLCVPAGLSVGVRVAKGRGLPWVSRPVVVGRGAEASTGLRLNTLRCARGGLLWWEQSGALFGALLDVLTGRRTWFGVRPRTCSDWYGLGAEWQALLSDAPIGLIHAQAWAGSDGLQADALAQEAEAVADAFYVVRRGRSEHARMLLANARRAWVATSSRPATIERPVWRGANHRHP